MFLTFPLYMFGKPIYGQVHACVMFGGTSYDVYGTSETVCIDLQRVADFSHVAGVFHILFVCEYDEGPPRERGLCRECVQLFTRLVESVRVGRVNHKQNGARPLVVQMPHVADDRLTTQIKGSDSVVAHLQLLHVKTQRRHRCRHLFPKFETVQNGGLAGIVQPKDQQMHGRGPQCLQRRPQISHTCRG